MKCAASSITPRQFLKMWIDSNQICAICKERMERYDVSLDHIIPRSKWGKNKLVNLQLAHAYCNSIKSDFISTSILYLFILFRVTPKQVG